MRRIVPSLALGALTFIAACGSGSDDPSITGPNPAVNRCPAAGSVTGAMTVLGCGDVKPKRTTGEIAVYGTTAYTTTWSNASPTSAIYIWDVAGDVPVLVDSVTVSAASTVGDVAVTGDGKYLVVATEYAGGSIIVYDLTNPRRPVQRSRYGSAETAAGVHTAEIGVVNGKLYAFLAVDQGVLPSRIVIVDLSNPETPQPVFAKAVGTPFIHDTFLRDGILFLGLWNGGVAIWDVGGGGKGGTPANPVEMSLLQTANGHVHNIWWFKDPSTGSAKYAFIGEESPGQVGVKASGDIHVVDVSNLLSPVEVAFYTVPNAGTHNFSVDEQNGFLYAAYYNGGVRAIDVRGDLGTCTAAQKSAPVNQAVQLCDLTKMGREKAVGLLDRGFPVYVWGVQYVSGSVYASDMLNGIWKLRAVSR